jgi:RNA polymerase sigma-70 factor (ECF subfamily)
MTPHEGYSGGDRPLQPSWSGSRTVQFNPGEARKAYLDMHEREYRAVVAFLMTCGAVIQDAEDSTQEAFLDLWRLTQRPGGWESIEMPRGWIRRVALRKYYRFQKEGGLRGRVVMDLTDTYPLDERDDHSELTVQTEFVRAILRELDADTRIVMAFLIDGFKSAEIARQVGTTDQKVRDLIKKGRKTLRTELVALRKNNGGPTIERS